MKDSINAAVDWWMDQLAAPNAAKHDAGDKNLNLFMGLVGSLSKPLSDEKVLLFSEILEHKLREEAKDSPLFRFQGYGLSLDVDYHPEGILGEAAREAGIPGSLYFPCKTRMRVHPNRVEVSCGYGQGPRTIFQGGSGFHA